MTISPVAYLRCFCVILFLVPAYYVLPGAGAAGSIPTLLGVVAFVWWLLARFVFGNRETAEPNPVRWALFGYLAVVMVSWIVGKGRVLAPLENSQSDRALLITLGFAGIALLAMDGLRTREQIERMVRVVCATSMIMVGAALVEFYLGFDLARAIQPPGFANNFSETELEVRSIFTRPRGTTMHPIELGVVGAGLVPLAYWARLTRPDRLRWAVPLAGLGLAAMISLSRSAVLTLAVAGAVMVIAVPWRQRLRFVLAGAGFVVAVGMVVSGLVGTLRALISQSGTDPSVQARVERFPLVMELVAQHPWFGHGFGTFTIRHGFLLDNEIQNVMITMGLVGLAVLLLFIGFVAAVAWRTQRRDTHERRIAGAALAALILGLFVSSYTFDASFYQILMNLMYLSIGMSGALWRVTSVDPAPAAAPALVPAGYRLTTAD